MPSTGLLCVPSPCSSFLPTGSRSRRWRQPATQKCQWRSMRVCAEATEQVPTMHATICCCRARRVVEGATCTCCTCLQSWRPTHVVSGSAPFVRSRQHRLLAPRRPARSGARPAASSSPSLPEGKDRQCRIQAIPPPPCANAQLRQLRQLRLC